MCLIDFCLRQSCPGKSVKKILLVEKHHFYQFNNFKQLKFFFSPFSHKKIVMEKCWNQPTYCTNIEKLKVLSEVEKMWKMTKYSRMKNCHFYFANTLSQIFPHTSGIEWCVEKSDLTGLTNHYARSSYGSAGKYFSPPSTNEWTGYVQMPNLPYKMVSHFIFGLKRLST